jgi:hypothetical protein
MPTLEELNQRLQGISTDPEDNKKSNDGEVGLATSIAAGVGSGVFKIFEGAATLGATLLDLGVDKNRAEDVEKFFDKINPFDEAAEATAAGKIAELIVNIGIPGGVAFKIGSGLTKATVLAKQSGNYLSKGEKLKRFGQGAVAGGVAEGVFVGDVEEAGTFGDFLGGPTEIERDTGDPQTELLNRLKFGLEGTAFTAGIGAIGKGISTIRNQAGTSKVAEGDLGKFLEKYISPFLRSRGFKPQEGFDIQNKAKGLMGADINAVDNAAREIDNIKDDIVNQYKKVALGKAAPDTSDKILEKMNDTLMSGSGKNGKLKPIFGLVDEFEIDPKTGRSGTITTGKKLYNVEIEPMDPVKVNNLRDELINTYKATDEQVTDLLDLFSEGRSRIGTLFTSMGRRFTPKALKDFEQVLPKTINNVIDRGYNVFKNNQGQTELAKNYPPTKAIIQKTVEEYKQIASQKGLQLTNKQAEDLVDQTWRGAYLTKGFVMSGQNASEALGQVRFKSVPKFLIDSVANEIMDKSKLSRTQTSNLSKISGVAQPVIKKLLGKTKNPMTSLVEGTANLSSQVRQNEYWDELVKKNNKLKIDYDAWVNGGKIGSEPRIPFLYNDTGEAIKYAGGRFDDFQKIGSELGPQTIDKYVDMMGSLKPVDEIEAARIAAKEISKEILNPVAGKVALKGYADEFVNKTQESLRSLPQQLYNNLILYPKATSQMAKTILAPFTHARNFISASAFAMANGILPFGNTKDVKAAWNALQVAGPGTRQANEFYQELLELGVVNSNVRLGDIKRLLQDVEFGSTLNNINSDYGLNRLMKKLNRFQKFAQDAYTAEDDFWKIFTYLGEKSRLDKAYRKAGLSLGQEFVDMNGTKQIFNDEYLKKSAADLVKNNVPNYAFVPEFIKWTRKLPVGNFVAFPAEMIRTSTNIVDTALKEIFYTTTINGKTVKPLQYRGLQRLTGMAITTTAIPLGTVAMFQTIYDVSKDEIDAMRRYVPQWSKNSTLIPFRDKDGNLSYVDFSHMNAYDTVTRPFQTVINAIESGRKDQDGIMDDFILGLIESTKEVASPFISESIWTQALQDVAPILGRGGVTSTGKPIWNREDSMGNKMSKAVAHLIEAQAPFNWNQLERLGMSVLPQDSLGRFDARGNEFKLGNEALGIIGFRKVDVDPAKGFNYKITEYKTGIRNSRNLFTAESLRGGVVTPEEIVDAYIDSNKALYRVNRTLYEDIQAAKILGMGENSLQENMERRGENKAFKSLNEGRFRPLTLSNDLKDLFEINAQRVGSVNPYEAAQDVISRIAEVLENASLSGDLFPDIENPFRESLLPTFEPAANINQLPPIITGANPIVMNANQQIVSGVGPNKLNQQIEKSNAIDSFIGR